MEGRLRISENAHLVFDVHRRVDELEEEARGRHAIGTTRRGIGPTYASKISRRGLRVVDFVGDWDAFCERYEALIDFYKYHYPMLSIDVKKSLEVRSDSTSYFVVFIRFFLFCESIYVNFRNYLNIANACVPW